MEKKIIELIMENFKYEDRLDENARLFFELSDASKMELLNLLSSSREGITGRFLNLIYEHEEDKNILKQIRKVLYALKTKGITVDEPVSKGTPVLKKKIQTDHKKVISYITNYDYYNQMAVLIGIESKKKIFFLVNGEIEFPTGLKELTITPFVRDEFDSILTSVRHEKGDKLAIAEAPANFTFRVLKEASNTSKRFIDEIRSLNGILKDNTMIFKTEFDLSNLPIPEDIAPLDVEDILKHAFFGLFRFKWDGIEVYKKAYMDISNPCIILPQYLLEEKKKAFFDSLLKKEDIMRLIPVLKTVFEVYAFIFHAYKEYAHYKGMVDYLKKDSSLTRAVLYLLEREFESQKEPHNGTDRFIINPYDLTDE